MFKWFRPGDYPKRTWIVDYFQIESSRRARYCIYIHIIIIIMNSMFYANFELVWNLKKFLTSDSQNEWKSRIILFYFIFYCCYDKYYSFGMVRDVKHCWNIKFNEKNIQQIFQCQFVLVVDEVSYLVHSKGFDCVRCAWNDKRYPLLFFVYIEILHIILDVICCFVYVYRCYLKCNRRYGPKK